ncbi:MAG: hypothetical protein ACREA1_08370 [Nitrosotalea sp.]
MSEDLIGAIQQIIILGKGDQGRLEYLLDVLQKGRPLPDSDQKYLQVVIPLYLGSQDPESYKKNAELAVEKLHEEVRQLDEKINKIQRKGFEKYVGRKTVLFFVTVFVGWNALQTYIQPVLSSFISNDAILQYVFPLNLAASYVHHSPLVWFGFLILLSSWPFIGAIHLAKFISSRKISSQ